MELKQYLYMIFGIMAFVMGRNVATRGIVGPATLTLTVIPVVGLTVLFAIDIYNLVQGLRAKSEDERDLRPARPKRKNSKRLGPQLPRQDEPGEG